MYCIHCGAELSTIARFCQNCGNAVAQTDAETQEEQRSLQISETAPEPRTQKSEEAQKNQSAPDQSKMQDFLATVPPDHDVYYDAIRGFESVKNGFSWPAFFFGFWWSLYKRLWLNALLYWLISVAVGFVLGLIFLFMGITLPLIVYYFFGLPVYLVWGANGNYWVGQNLINRGYSRVSMDENDGAEFQPDSANWPDESKEFTAKFDCPFCQNHMADYGQCAKCGNTVDQWVLEANG